MYFFRNLFRSKEKIKEYKPIDYEYICSICKTYKVKIEIIGLTEPFYGPFYGPFVDSYGNKHLQHDYNTGEVELTCESNHITKTAYPLIFRYFFQAVKGY